ncbi:MAG TPA: MdtA/MuxA family multidrug efflux RND transporter periplasmic adaptor subunit [Thermoanaerobaculia bacterium]
MDSDRTTGSSGPGAAASALTHPPSILPAERSEVPSRRRRWLWVAGVVVVALVLFLLLPRGKKENAAAAKSEKGSAASRSVPVTAATAKTGDINVYVNGLGTVTALNTVTVRSRVDGQLINVAYREGQFVHQGDLLAEIDPRPFQVQLTQAEGQKAKDAAALKNARIDLERYQVLMQQDAIPRQQLDTQAATVNQFEAAVKTDEGQVESARLNLVYSRITAPVSGRVGLRLVDVGNMVHASDANGLLVITQLQPITVLFTIPADRLPAVQQQLATGRKLVTEAYDRELKVKIATGTLLAVDNQIDQTTGTVKLKSIFSNEKNELFPNQFVNARLLVNTIKGTVLIPTAAIQRSPQSTFVYVIKPDSTVEMRPVDVQLTEGDDAAIRKGVASGESVVIDGVDKLQPGTKVAVAGATTGPGGASGASTEAAPASSGSSRKGPS